jgi:decaprenyl-phosphate phosphoribosyltransferase
MAVAAESAVVQDERQVVPTTPVGIELPRPASAPPRAHVLPRRGTARALVALARPRQWLKNGLVIAAAGAAGALGRDDVPLRVSLAFVAFCLIASGIYAINDVRDAAENRQHPRKRYRPVAAGALTPKQALAAGISLVTVGLLLCASVRPLLALVGAGYLALTVSYTLFWRSIVILDLVAIGGGFVLRAVAGGVAAPVALSKWFVLVVSAAAVLVAAGKRQAELRRAVGRNAARRQVLHSYPRWLLELILLGSAGIALLAYCVWAFKLSGAHGVPWRQLTILPFAACLVRYGALLRAGAGEAPEELVLGDRALRLAGIAWLLLFAVSVGSAG